MGIQNYTQVHEGLRVPKIRVAKSERALGELLKTKPNITVSQCNTETAESGLVIIRC